MRLLQPILLVLSAVVGVSAFSCLSGITNGDDPSQTNVRQILCPPKSTFCTLRYHKLKNETLHDCGATNPPENTKDGNGLMHMCPEQGACSKRRSGYVCCCNSPLCNVRKPEDFDVVDEAPMFEETKTCLDGLVSTEPSEKKTEKPLRKMECSRGLCARELIKNSPFDQKYRLGCASEESAEAVCRNLPTCKPAPEGPPEGCCCTGKDCNSLPWITVDELPPQSIFISPDGLEEPTVDGPHRRNKNPLKNLNKNAAAFFSFLLKQLQCLLKLFGL